jgi:hypothetical protein
MIAERIRNFRKSHTGIFGATILFLAFFGILLLMEQLG